MQVEENLDFDRSVVTLALSEIIIKNEHNPSFVNKKINWEGFQTDLNNRIELNKQLKTKE